MSIDRISQSSSPVTTAKPAGKNTLHQEKNTLCANIQEVKNVLTDVKMKIKADTNDLNKNKALLTSLKGIASKHGDNANIRLKNDHFKLGQGSNFLKNLINGGRYKLEQQAATSKLVVKGSEVSARTGIAKLTQQIQTFEDSLVSSNKELKNNKDEYESLNVKLGAVDQQIETFNKAKIAADKADNNNKALRNNFSMIYQSNEGCKAINAEARHQFGNANQSAKLNGNQVIAEYVKTHGDNVFSGGNAPVKSAIQSHCSDLSTLVKDVAKAWYSPTDTTTTSHRGQGMTQDGINKLITQFNNDRAGSVYKLGQFFSTSKEVNVAKAFADRTGDSVKIMFEVKGNSGRGIVVSGGLKFANNEREVLYSPLAKFAVTDIKGSNAKGYTIKLNEVEQDTKAKLLPY
ncbi:ADP-ribosyltransferase domain-containing protein [Yersinia enterocolitica]|uniref:ADP-ribosyltransferase domain-containing protein n=1 Tax=Yersinia enterocolitica TaxID=630 RepID=UPI00065A90A7|nr:ADP-ribosyltransferase domain-containing protein [Yersinia enterocolitica]CRY18359.1 NAD:arginine ADP-ribosyltransferase [Yersinia enterocolitica]